MMKEAAMKAQPRLTRVQVLKALNSSTSSLQTKNNNKILASGLKQLPHIEVQNKSPK